MANYSAASSIVSGASSAAYFLVERLRVGENVVRALADIRRGCHDGFLGAQRRRGRESVDLLRVAAGEDLDACRAGTARRPRKDQLYPNS